MDDEAADTVHLFRRHGEFSTYLFETHYYREVSVLIQRIGMSTKSLHFFITIQWNFCGLVGVLLGDSPSNRACTK
jgi:hypothetical protein